MAKRELPPRSTRGQRLTQNEELEKQDDRLYEQLFGKNVTEDQQDDDYFIRKYKYNTRKLRLLTNLNKYSYCKAYHYYFDLDYFPRLEDSKNYVIDIHKSLGATFSKDTQKVGSSTIGYILNRKYFALPITDGQEKKEGRCKNICHGYLFHNEDKKYQLDRLIQTCTRIFLNFEKLYQNGLLYQFSVLKKDLELVPVLNTQLSIEQRRELLARKLQILQYRKYSNSGQWEAYDNTYYYHSLNQQLHNYITNLKNSFRIDNLVTYLCYRSAYHMYILKSANYHKENVVRYLLTNLLTYYQSYKTLLSEYTIAKVSTMYSYKLLAFNEYPVVSFPVDILNFGSTYLQRFADEVVAMRLNSHSYTTYYSGKQLWLKLFNRSLNLLKEDKSVGYYQYHKNARKKIDDLRKYLKSDKSNGQSSFKWLTFDHCINHAGLSYYSLPERILFFGVQELKYITFKDFICLIAYYRICLSLADISRFLENNYSFAAVIGSEYYPKLCHGAVYAVGTANFGVLNSALEALCNHLAMPDPLPVLGCRILYYHKTTVNVGFIWKSFEHDSEKWETEKYDEDIEEEIAEENKDEKKKESSEEKLNNQNCEYDSMKSKYEEKYLKEDEKGFTEEEAFRYGPNSSPKKKVKL